MLFFPRETFPTERVRLTALFGRELLGRGHAIDLVMQAADTDVRVGRHDWSGRSVWVGPTDDGDGLLGRTRKNLLGVLHDLRWLFKATRKDYDSVLVSDKYLLATVAIVVARLRGLRFLFWLTFPYHEAHLTLGREAPTRNRRLVLLRGIVARDFLYRWILPRCDHVFVQSQRMLDGFSSRGVDPSRMTAIVTGIDLDGIAPRSMAAPAASSHCLTVGYLGTLVPERRLEVLIDMLAELRRHGVSARLLLVGDGARPEHRRLLEAHAARLNLSDQIEITGFLPRREALTRIQESDVCISPFYPSTILEVASPTKLVEYLALGIPSVANTHPDQAVILRESRAGVCVPWGARHFARGVRWLATRSLDELNAMACRGREWVSAHRTYARIADSFETGYIAAVRQARQ
jgi:glycosyltransferase involved in cell wall biosynthesis